VRIPRVKNETGTCTSHVLALEFLQGTPLFQAIEHEQDRVALGLGMDNAKELKAALSKRMRDHFEQGDAATSNGMEMLTGRQAKLLQVGGPFAVQVLRTLGGAKEFVDNVTFKLQTIGGKLTRALTPSDGIHTTRTAPQANGRQVDLSRALKVLVHVHGLQLIKDGFFNADPHPGNVLILPDGWLGFLDYSMVSRLSGEDQITLARTVLALSKSGKQQVAQIYNDSGYRACWKKERDIITDENILH
jgi:predicted unusual protein kinase regulating ubiquinone biosynthesis (AarF/ABC1/UbiB family)